jgi:hypothetical protein
MGGANGSRNPSAAARRAKAECAPDDKLRDTHQLLFTVMMDFV